MESNQADISLLCKYYIMESNQADISLLCKYYKKGQRRRWHTAKCSVTQFYRIVRNRIAHDVNFDI